MFDTKIPPLGLSVAAFLLLGVCWVQNWSDLLPLWLSVIAAVAGAWYWWKNDNCLRCISVFLFGIEELATQLEEPFTILPMQAFCDKIYNWCMEIVSWQPGDNGMRVNKPKTEHTVAFLGEIPSYRDDEASHNGASVNGEREGRLKRLLSRLE